MSLTLHFHPLASYCHKVLIALYENDTPFTPNMVDLADETERAALLKLWPIGKFPVLRDDGRNQTVPESTVIIEYLDRYYPGGTQLIPSRRRPRVADAAARSFLRPLCPRADAEDRRRSIAPRGTKRIRMASRKPRRGCGPATA